MDKAKLQDMINNLKEMAKTPWWVALKEIIEGKVQELDMNIFTLKNKNDLTYNSTEVLIYKRSVYNEIANIVEVLQANLDAAIQSERAEDANKKVIKKLEE
jgi:hypothetical protein